MVKNEKGKKLSIIVPAYMQEKTIAEDLRNIVSVLDNIDYSYEVIVVVDGREDDTYEKAKRAKMKNVKVVGYRRNHGKGYAVRYGIARSSGGIIGFIDAGADINPLGLQMLLNHFEWYEADIIVGSKWHPVSKVKYPLWRKIISKGYGLYVKFLFGLRIKDTQLGMKFFRREVLEKVMPRLLVKQYAMDIEMLAVADRIGYTRIFEAPIELNWDELNSSLTVSRGLVSSIWNMFWDTLAVFYRMRILRYYDDARRQRWRYDEDLKMRVNIG